MSLIEGDKRTYYQPKPRPWVTDRLLSDLSEAFRKPDPIHTPIVLDRLEDTRVSPELVREVREAFRDQDKVRFPLLMTELEAWTEYEWTKYDDDEEDGDDDDEEDD